MTISRSALVALTALPLLLTACSGQDTSSAAGSGDGVSVVVGFYPMQFVAERVGGDAVTVTNVTRPGAEPHDVELAPRDVEAFTTAAAIYYLPGFQPAVDSAIETAGAADRAVDVSPAAELEPAPEGTEVHDDHAGEQADEHADTGLDPHFWLDPTRLASVTTLVADDLAARDPEHAEQYRSNADALNADLMALDEHFATGLANCANTDLVTSHEAFGYLARAYGLTQVGVSGLDPQQEPSPARLAELSAFVREHDVTTIYTETLASPAVAQTLADETGAGTAVLDPLEGLTDDSGDADYLSVMETNLGTLRAGQSCS
ncbi:MAG: metal ABC transporter substrate-binding protein [Actinomycetales bacterium]